MFYDSGIKIESLGDFINEVMQLKIRVDGQEYFQWYRGHANNSWELIPKVQRGFVGSEEELFRKERCFTNDFQAKASILDRAATLNRLENFDYLKFGKLAFTHNRSWLLKLYCEPEVSTLQWTYFRGTLQNYYLLSYEGKA